MKELQVPDMHCEKCVERINKALKAEDIPCKIDLAAKTVAVPTEATAKAIDALDDLGFTANIE